MSRFQCLGVGAVAFLVLSGSAFAEGDAAIGDLVTVSMRGRAGRVTAVHGSERSPRAALRALLVAEGLGRPFPRAALEEAEALDDGDVLADRGRRDLRDQRVITIDPEGAKDHDDAIAVAAAWRAGGPDPAPAAPLGLAADGVVEIDLVRDGPHALVAGSHPVTIWSRARGRCTRTRP